jgi:Gpi18-like mannosyltransferase
MESIKKPLLLIFYLFLFRILIIIFVIFILFPYDHISWFIFAKWDADYYLSIASGGYNMSNYVFFPLYPILIKIVNLFLHNYIFSALIISNLSYLLSLLLLYELARKVTRNSFVSKITIILFSFFPSSFFTSLIYTESLFLVFTLLSFYGAINRQWKIAAISGSFASLTRINGILIILPLICIYLTKNKKLKKSILLLLLPLLSSICFILYLKLVLNVGLTEFINLQKSEFKRNVFSIKALIYDVKYWLNELLKGPLISDGFPWKIYFLLNILSVPFVIFISFYALFKRITFKIPLCIYVLSTLVFYLLSGSLDSLIRYILPLFPLYIFLADFLCKYVRSKFLMGLTLGIFLILQILLFAYHITGIAVF